MTIRYFADTDTALIDSSENEISETREVSENVDIDLDRDGNPLSMTSRQGQAFFTRSIEPSSPRAHNGLDERCGGRIAVEQTAFTQWRQW